MCHCEPSHRSTVGLSFAVTHIRKLCRYVSLRTVTPFHGGPIFRSDTYPQTLPLMPSYGSPARLSLEGRLPRTIRHGRRFRSASTTRYLPALARRVKQTVTLAIGIMATGHAQSGRMAGKTRAMGAGPVRFSTTAMIADSEAPVYPPEVLISADRGTTSFSPIFRNRS
jgi:hypothetical protein